MSVHTLFFHGSFSPCPLPRVLASPDPVSGRRRLDTRPRPKIRRKEDPAWKRILRRRLYDFLRFFFPKVYASLDLSVPPEFLDKELEELIPFLGSSQHIVDVLVRLALKDGRRVPFLVHIEIQGRLTRAFSPRMFRCAYRIYDRCGEWPEALAVFTGRGSAPKENFEIQGFQSGVSFRFAQVSIESYRGREKELEKDRNIFSQVVLAHLRDHESRTVGERRRWKGALLRFLLTRKKRQFTRRKIREVIQFLDRILVLPPEAETALRVELQGEFELQGSSNMPEIWTFERLAREDGVKEGRVEGEGLGLREAIRVALKLRFGPKGLALIPRIEKVHDVTRLRHLVKAAEKVPTLEDFKAKLALR
jgi:hypothetical protein